MIVSKRDGRLEEFEPNKILESIKRAALAVELRDEDIQKRSKEIKRIKQNLIDSGVKHEDAEEQAEELFNGYIENGEYTEYDEEEALDVLDVVIASIESLGLDEDEHISTDLIQGFIEKALMVTGHSKTAKEYIIKGADRERVREMNTSLMKSFEQFTFGDSKDVETKRENANIDGDSSMGTMLKYGSEGAKTYNLLHLLSPDASAAHSSGDIHIHDLDFYSLTETCITEHSKLVIKPCGNKSKPVEVEVSYFDKYLDGFADDTVVPLEKLKVYVYDIGGFKCIKNCVRHSSEGKEILRIHSRAATIEVTSNHRVPVLVGGKKKELHAKDIKPGMVFIGAMYNDDNIKYGEYTEADFEIDSVLSVEYSGKYVYDFETTSHYFMTNGVRVHNCCQIDLEKLFKNGFNTGHGFLREPGEIRSYAALACIAIQSNQNDQHGGQSVPCFDHYMAPGVAKSFVKQLHSVMKIRYPECEAASPDEPDKLNNDEIYEGLKKMRNRHRLILDKLDKVKGFIRDRYCKKLSDSEIEYLILTAMRLTEEDTHQAMEAVVHNLNSMHSRAGAQVPFSSLNFGTDTSDEGRMVIKCLLRATEEGLGNGETPIFPVSVMKVKSGVNYNPGDPNYDLFKYSMLVSSKRLFPNYTFIDAPFNLQYYKEGHIETEVATMGCRTRVIGNVYDPNNQVVTGRGNLSFTSINLPRLAIKASNGEIGQGDIEKFYSLLDDMLELVHKQLIERFKVQCRKHPKNYPFLMGQGVWLGSDKLGADDDITDVLKQGTLSVGFIGLAETLKMLIGKHHGESEEAQKLGLAIIGHMRNATDRWSKEENMNYGLIGTPAEGLSGRFTRIDKKKYGIIPGVTDREYYTNSSHVPVYFPISAFKKIDIEAPYHGLCNAGHIAYIEMDGDPSKNIDAFESVIRYMHDKGIGYGAVNHPVDRDPVCGYVGIIDEVCPRCGRREGEPMTEEMWQKIKGYPSDANSGLCGYCGDPLEELDRTPNYLE